MRRASIAVVFAIMVVTAALHSATRAPGLAGENRLRRVSTAIVTPVAERIPVFVEHTGTDAAGRVFVDGLKSGLQASSRFTLAASDQDARVVVVIVSVSPAQTRRIASAISLAYVANNEHRSLLASAARFVGRDRAAAMGKETVAELTAILDAYQAPDAQ
jgi:hypothetical protein